MLQIYKQTITDQHEYVMLQLANMFDNQILIGGTGLALQIGHRKSEDLDYVINSPVPHNITSLLSVAAPKETWQHQLQNDQQYTGFCSGIKVTFFHDDVSFLHPTNEFARTQIANISDIFSSKLFTIGKRAVWRDYVDIAILLDKGLVALEDGIAEAKIRHQVDEKWILEPLTYFSDITYAPIDYLGKSYSDAEIQKILETEAMQYTDLRLSLASFEI